MLFEVITCNNYKKVKISSSEHIEKIEIYFNLSQIRKMRGICRERV